MIETTEKIQQLLFQKSAPPGEGSACYNMIKGLMVCPCFGGAFLPQGFLFPLAEKGIKIV